ncbi:hypothetical protein M8J77_005155 [Diaphorina citri]|nr:hypothetical protein M8J77_005155 [Diaphorina citri]
MPDLLTRTKVHGLFLTDRFRKTNLGASCSVNTESALRATVKLKSGRLVVAGRLIYAGVYEREIEMKQGFPYT